MHCGKMFLAAIFSIIACSNIGANTTSDCVSFYFLQGARLFQEGKQLNGTERFVVDNIASQEECTMLSKLVEVSIERYYKSSLSLI